MPWEEGEDGHGGFAIARYPITNAQYQVFIDDRGYQADEW
ncbi:MAG: formylglycine-generating enzyme family protein [Chromatiaceae bacterium]|nr:formylglycine-generating enzyme family protein [Chromatiaceae bacterium]